MAGRPTTYSEEMEMKADHYIENYAEYGHPLPSIVGMAVVLAVHKCTLYEWAKRERGGFADTLAHCNDAQELALLNKGLTNEFNATIVKLALANHGYSEKTRTDITSGGREIKNDWHIYPVTANKG